MNLFNRILIALCLGSLFVSAFFSKITSTRLRTTNLSLNMMSWGLQRVGEPILTDRPAVSTPSDSSDPFASSLFGRRQSAVTGVDERDDTQEFRNYEYYESLSSLDLNFRKQRLLNGLSNIWGTAESLEQIACASESGLLPSSSLIGISITSGGLTQDWDFDF
jgi:hypothetical protein